jgi:hypothetical protein
MCRNCCTSAEFNLPLLTDVKDDLAPVGFSSIFGTRLNGRPPNLETECLYKITSSRMVHISVAPLNGRRTSDQKVAEHIPGRSEKVPG